MQIRLAASRSKNNHIGLSVVFLGRAETRLSSRPLRSPGDDGDEQLKKVTSAWTAHFSAVRPKATPTSTPATGASRPRPPEVEANNSIAINALEGRQLIGQPD